MGVSKFKGLVVLSAVLVLLGGVFVSGTLTAGDLSGALGGNVTIDGTYTYNGMKQCPTGDKVKVIGEDDDDPPILILNTDYTVACDAAENLNAGTGAGKVTVTLTASGAEKFATTEPEAGDFIVKSFDIAKAAVNDGNIANFLDYSPKQIVEGDPYVFNIAGKTDAGSGLNVTNWGALVSGWPKFALDPAGAAASAPPAAMGTYNVFIKTTSAANDNINAIDSVKIGQFVIADPATVSRARTNGGLVVDTAGITVPYAGTITPALAKSLVDALLAKAAFEVIDSAGLNGGVSDTIAGARNIGVSASAVDAVVKNNAGGVFGLTVYTAIGLNKTSQTAGSAAQDSLRFATTVPIRVVKGDVALSHLDLTAFEAWRKQNALAAPVEGADAYRFATGSPVSYGSAIGLKASLGLSGLGSGTLSYAGKGNTKYAKSVTAPADTGTYNVTIVYGGTGNTNFNGNELLIGVLRVQYAPYAANLFLTTAQTVTYKFNAAASPYVISGPTILPGIAGTIDSIFYTPAGNGGLSGADIKAKPNHGTAGKSGLCSLWVAGKNDTGSIGITAIVKGKVSGNIFLSDAVNYKVTVGRRSIDSVKVFSVETYNGNVITPETYFVYAGGNTLKYNAADPSDPTNEFAVLTGADVRKEYNMVNAGPASLVVTGVGKYTGRKNGDYTIQKKKIYVSGSVDGTRKYDGTTVIETDTAKAVKLKLWFDTTATSAEEQAAGAEMINLVTNGVAGSADFGKVDTLKWNRDYSATAAYNNANAGVRSMNAAVTLLGNGPVSKNYTFVAANGKDTNTVAVAKGGLDIEKRTPLDYDAISLPGGDTATFVFDIPDTTDAYPPTAHYSNGQVRGIETATNKVGYRNGMAGGAITVLYGYQAKPYYDTTIAVAKDTTIAPRDAGVYPVKVKIPGNENFVGGTYLLGEYRIKAPAVAKFAAGGNLADTNVREGNSVVLAVAASSPNGPGSALSYKWYRYTSPTDSAVIAGATGPSYTVSTGVEGDVLEYAVKVTNNPGAAVQTSADVMSAHSHVTVKKAPISMSKAFIVINPEKDWIYKGDSIKPTGSDIAVWLPVTLEDGTKDTVELEKQYYSLTYLNNVNVGTATVRASGVDVPGAVDAYSGTVSTTFKILPKTLERSDLTYTASRVYSGDSTLGAAVKTAQPKTGMGAITTFYDGSASVPVDVGEYDVTVTVAAGTNFSAGEAAIGTYRITQRKPDSASVVFGGIPVGHKQGDSAAVYGVGEVKLRGTGYESVTVYYGADTIVPTTAGSYLVTIEVAGGENYTDGEVTLGMYNIGAPISVAETVREIPKATVTQEASVAPVSRVAAAAFTAGPSPVSKNTGKITFFSEKPIKSGSLYVFDANGNAMAKVSAKSGSGKDIASWNLRDKKGAAIADGTYAVKGALVGKDGKREKVSFVFSVVK